MVATDALYMIFLIFITLVYFYYSNLQLLNYSSESNVEAEHHALCHWVVVLVAAPSTLSDVRLGVPSNPVGEGEEAASAGIDGQRVDVQSLGDLGLSQRILGRQ